MDKAVTVLDNIIPLVESNIKIKICKDHDSNAEDNPIKELNGNGGVTLPWIEWEKLKNRKIRSIFVKDNILIIILFDEHKEEK